MVRLDTMERIWINVTQFTTVDYWNLPIPEAMKYGYCIAAYREKTRQDPMDKKGHRGTLPLQQSSEILQSRQHQQSPDGYRFPEPERKRILSPDLPVLQRRRSDPDLLRH